MLPIQKKPMRVNRILSGMSLVFLLWFAPSRTRMVKKDEEIALVINLNLRGIPTQESSEQKRLSYRTNQAPRVIRSIHIPKSNRLLKKRTF